MNIHTCISVYYMYGNFFNSIFCCEFRTDSRSNLSPILKDPFFTDTQYSSCLLTELLLPEICLFSSKRLENEAWLCGHSAGTSAANPLGVWISTVFILFSSAWRGDLVTLSSCDKQFQDSNILPRRAESCTGANWELNQAIHVSPNLESVFPIQTSYNTALTIILNFF